MEERANGVTTRDLGSLRIPREDRSRPRRRWWPWPVALLLLAGGAGVCFYLAGALPRDVQAYLEEKLGGGLEVETGVAVLKGGSGTLSATVLTANGYVAARRQAGVSPKVTGRLNRLHKDLGDSVQKGELIAELDNGDLLAQLEEARATVWVADLTAQRERQLLGDEVGAQAQADIALARAKEAAARLKYIEEQIENTRVRAPFDGRIIVKNNEVGETLSLFGAQSTRRSGPMFVIADFSEFEVEADVNESNIGKVAAGQPAEISLDAVPGHRYRGRVRQVVPTADRQKATVQVKVTIVDHDDRVFPDMSAKVSFLSQEAAAGTTAAEPARVLAPAAALVDRDGKKVVFVVETDGTKSRAKAVEVTAGPAESGYVVIERGLAGGETVVLHPPAALGEGRSLRPSPPR